MKILRLRFAVFCLAVFCFVCVPITKPVLNIDSQEKTTYYFYTSHVENDIENAETIQNGNYTIVACDLQFANSVKGKLSDIYGESVRISNYKSKTLEKLLEKYSTFCVKVENFDCYKSMLCYDALLSNYVIVDSQKVNTQIVYNKSEINIGYPLILNGF